MNISQSKTDSPEEVCQEGNVENNSSISQDDGVEPVANKMKETMEIFMTKLCELRNSKSIMKIAFQEQISNVHLRRHAFRNCNCKRSNDNM